MDENIAEIQNQAYTDEQTRLKEPIYTHYNNV